MYACSHVERRGKGGRGGVSGMTLPK